MATTSNLFNARVKAEPQDITNHFPPLPQFQPENDGADLTKSVNDLAKFAAATQAFKDRYDELQKHLDFIKQAIDEKSNELTASLPVSATAGNIIGVSVQQAIGNGIAIQTALDSATIPKSENLNEIEIEKVSENEIVTLCKKMSSRGLRKYMLNHLSDADVALREQLPEALKSAPKPAKLVFESIGKFFVQGSKAYNKNLQIIALRQAAVLVLECYLVSGCVVSKKEMDGSLRNEVESAAVQWRRRLIVEGGVANAVEIDARGLLLFIAGFGIPSIFSNDDVLNLVRLSNPGEISQALRQSQALLKRVSVMAEGLVKRGMAIEVVDLVYTFGFQEKYSIHTMLTSFLLKSEEAWKKAKAKQESHDFPNGLKEANEKYLNDLKSVVNCLEGHKIDFEKLLPGWQIKDKIINIEKDISDINKKIQEKVVPKRKVDKINSPIKMKIPEAKRSRFPEKDSYVGSPSVTALQEQRIASHIDGNNSYDYSLVARYLDGRSYGYSNYYPTASSAPIGSVSGSLPESYLGGTVSGVGNMHRGGISAPAMPAGIGAPSGSYSGYQRDTTMENVETMMNSSSRLYHRWHGTGTGTGTGAGALSDESSVGKSFGEHHSVERVIDLYGRTTTDGYSGYLDHPSVGVTGRSGGSDLYGRTTTDGYSGYLDHPSVGVTGRSGGSDLYSFADSVFDR